jgi:hypothetical protein
MSAGEGDIQVRCHAEQVLDQQKTQAAKLIVSSRPGGLAVPGCAVTAVARFIASPPHCADGVGRLAEQVVQPPRPRRGI